MVLALGVAIALVSGVLTAELTPNAVTPQETTFLSTLGGAMVGALATYLGVTHINRPNGGNDMETETPERDEPVEPSAPEPEPTEPEPEPTEPEPEPTEPEPEPAPAPPEPDPDFPDEEVDDMTQGMGPGNG